MSSPLDEVLQALQALMEAQAQTPVPREAGQGNFRCERCEDCSHCRFCNDCNACEDCTYCDDCDGCSGCTHCKDCERCRETTHSRWSSGCSKSSYLTLCLDCEGCVQCFACVGLTGAEFCILNEKLPRKAYFSRVAALRAALEERVTTGWRPPWSEVEEEEADDEGVGAEAGAEAVPEEPVPVPEEPEDAGEVSVEIPATSLASPTRARPRLDRAEVTVDVAERDAPRSSLSPPWSFTDARRERPSLDAERIERAPEQLPEPPPYGSTGSFEAAVPDPDEIVEPPSRPRDRYGWSAQTEGTPIHLDWPALEDRAGEPRWLDERLADEPRARARWSDERFADEPAPEPRGGSRWLDDPPLEPRARPPWPNERAAEPAPEPRARSRWPDEREPVPDPRARTPWPDEREPVPDPRARTPWPDEREPVPDPRARTPWPDERAAEPAELESRRPWDEDSRLSELRTRRTREGMRRIETEPEPPRVESHPTFEWPRAAESRREPRADDLDWRRRETAASPRALPPPELESIADLEEPPPEPSPLERLDLWSPFDELQRPRLGPEDQTEPDAPVVRRARSRAEVSDAAKMTEAGDEWDESPASAEHSRGGVGTGRRPERPRADTPRTGLMRGRAPARPAAAPTPRQADAPSIRRARRPARSRDESPTAPYPTGDGEEG